MSKKDGGSMSGISRISRYSNAKEETTSLYAHRMMEAEHVHGGIKNCSSHMSQQNRHSRKKKDNSKASMTGSVRSSIEYDLIHDPYRQVCQQEQYMFDDNQTNSFYYDVKKSRSSSRRSLNNMTNSQISVIRKSTSPSNTSFNPLALGSWIQPSNSFSSANSRSCKNAKKLMPRDPEAKQKTYDRMLRMVNSVDSIPENSMLQSESVSAMSYQSRSSRAWNKRQNIQRLRKSRALKDFKEEDRQHDQEFSQINGPGTRISFSDYSYDGSDRNPSRILNTISSDSTGIASGISKIGWAVCD